MQNVQVLLQPIWMATQAAWSTSRRTGSEDGIQNNWLIFQADVEAPELVIFWQLDLNRQRALIDLVEHPAVS